MLTRASPSLLLAAGHPIIRTDLSLVEFTVSTNWPNALNNAIPNTVHVIVHRYCDVTVANQEIDSITDPDSVVFLTER